MKKLYNLGPGIILAPPTHFDIGGPILAPQLIYFKGTMVHIPCTLGGSHYWGIFQGAYIEMEPASPKLCRTN